MIVPSPSLQPHTTGKLPDEISLINEKHFGRTVSSLRSLSCDNTGGTCCDLDIQPLQSHTARALVPPRTWLGHSCVHSCSSHLFIYPLGTALGIGSLVSGCRSSFQPTFIRDSLFHVGNLENNRDPAPALSVPNTVSTSLSRDVFQNGRGSHQKSRTQGFVHGSKIPAL